MTSSFKEIHEAMLRGGPGGVIELSTEEYELLKNSRSPAALSALAEQDFSEHPQTMGDIRSDKSKNAKDWTPRDALIRTLREIDRGELDARKIVMVIAYKRAADELVELPPGACEFGTMTRQAGTENVYDTFGLLAWGQHVMARD